MFQENIIPLRGVGVDWSGDKEKEQLRKSQNSAKEFIKIQLQGYPDFDKFASYLCLPGAKKATRKTKHRKNLKSKK